MNFTFEYNGKERVIHSEDIKHLVWKCNRNNVVLQMKDGEVLNFSRPESDHVWRKFSKLFSGDHI